MNTIQKEEEEGKKSL